MKRRTWPLWNTAEHRATASTALLIVATTLHAENTIQTKKYLTSDMMVVSFVLILGMLGCASIIVNLFLAFEVHHCRTAGRRTLALLSLT
jgi:hypothetical protein